jgi:hypothetical protein
VSVAVWTVDTHTQWRYSGGSWLELTQKSNPTSQGPIYYVLYIVHHSMHILYYIYV